MVVSLVFIYLLFIYFQYQTFFSQVVSILSSPSLFLVQLLTTCVALNIIICCFLKLSNFVVVAFYICFIDTFLVYILLLFALLYVELTRNLLTICLICVLS